MGLLPEEAQIPGGAIIFDNQDLLSLPERQMQLLRGKSVAMIFQEPMTSLNPLMTVGQQLEETLQRHEVLGRRERRSQHDAGRGQNQSCGEAPATVSARAFRRYAPAGDDRHGNAVPATGADCR
jgi:ABC-type dipeptide/oligopeptide/nickel transport system ATPase component